MTAEEQAVRAAIVSTVLDYFEGWFDGDAGPDGAGAAPRAGQARRRTRCGGRWTRRPPSR